MKQIFEDFYEEKFPDFVMKRNIKKAWIGCRVSAINLLDKEAVKANGRKKMIIRQCITVLKENL